VRIFLEVDQNLPKMGKNLITMLTELDSSPDDMLKTI